MDPDRPEDPLDSDAEGEVSKEEREQILGQIDRAIRSVRRPLDEELADVRPHKRGGLFPIVVNAAAVALVVAGGFLLSSLFKVKNESITVSSAGFVSAEGDLLETLRRESEGLVREKEAQIASIEQRLQSMDRQTEELRARLDSDLKAREQELRRKLGAALAAERERLRAAGTGDSAIDRRLLEFERQRESTLRSELEQYRGELEAALQQRERELADSREELRAALRNATADRARLEAELSAREADLKAQFERERATLQQEASAAEQRLAALQEARQQESLVEDQLTGYYEEALARLENGDPEGARESLSKLSALLGSPALARVPALLQRRPLHRALAAALEELIRLRMTAERSAGAVEEASSLPAVSPAGADAEAAEQAKIVDGLKREIDTLEKTIEGLRAAARERSVADSAAERERIAELEFRLARLNADLEVLEGEKERLERWKTSVDGLSERYAQTRSRVRRLISQGGESNLREAQRLLLQSLQDPTAAAILPEVAENLAAIDRSLASQKQDTGEQIGREAALTDILRYLNYLSRGTGGREVESRVMAQVREDPLYRAVIREIQILRAGGSASGDLALPYLLLGTVVSVSGSQIVIEPLGDGQVSTGAVVQIRRSDALEQETLIARGTVQQIRGGKIYVRIDSIVASGENPQNRDLVYAEPR